MTKTSPINIYLESGAKRTFASATDWPGWSRSGRDEESALVALLEAAPRYAEVAKRAKVDFTPPTDVAGFTITERLQGGSATDFGAPVVIPSADKQPVDKAAVARFGALLDGCWKTLDAAARAAEGKELRKGPRGGGRELEKVLVHVLESEGAYLSSVGRKLTVIEGEPPQANLARTRHEVLDTLDSALHGGLPERGPRGGVYWPVRYFVRRLAWHVLDHAWEIEDRIM